MKLLITGSTGLVGSACVEFFTQEGWEVMGIDHDMRHKFFDTPSKKADWDVDIRDQEQVESLFKLRGPFNAIIHTAAQPSHDYSKEHVLEDFDVNARGTVILLEAARRYSPNAVFVHCSTDKIYGAGMVGTTPFNEETPVKPPLSPFGVAKLAADFYVQEYSAQGWLTTGVFRMGCITGRAHEGAEQHGFLAYLTKCIKEGKIYNIYGFNGNQVRDQIHARDLARAFGVFIANPHSGAVYNIGGGESRAISPLEAGKRIGERYRKPFLHRLVDTPRFGDREWDVHDISKFKTDYPNWEYEYSLDDILDDLCGI